jgi:hypothetical protein
MGKVFQKGDMVGFMKVGEETCLLLKTRLEKSNEKTRYTVVADDLMPLMRSMNSIRFQESYFRAIDAEGFEWKRVSNILYRMVKFPDCYRNRLNLAPSEYDIRRLVKNENEWTQADYTILVHLKNDAGFSMVDLKDNSIGARVYVGMLFSEIFEKISEKDQKMDNNEIKEPTK